MARCYYRYRVSSNWSVKSSKCASSSICHSATSLCRIFRYAAASPAALAFPARRRSSSSPSFML